MSCKSFKRYIITSMIHSMHTSDIGNSNKNNLLKYFKTHEVPSMNKNANYALNTVI